MKALLIITFKKIKNVELNDDVLKQEPKLLGITKDVMRKLCKAFEEHFKSKGVEIKTSFEVVE